jgi:alpha-beta hydrolase superfamily lysophospholipase
MKKLFRLILVGLAALFAIYIIAALVMTFWPEPAFAQALTLSDGTSSDLEVRKIYQEHQFTMRDGTHLFARHFPSESELTILLIHGVASDSSEFDRSAKLLQEATSATIFALDLRGHGQSEGERGDVDYIGQYEDDVADVIAEIRAGAPNGRLVLAGHSMGGGIALRFAQIDNAPPVDGHLLFAPHLGANAPTLPAVDPEGGETDGSAAFIQLHIPRIIGLTMLNTVGIRAFNGMGTLFFNLPSESARVRTYSYRAMVNSAPTDYAASLTAVAQPLLVIVGSNDEAFVAEEFEPAVSQYSDGDVVVIVGETHNGIIENEMAIAAAQNWLRMNGR